MNISVLVSGSAASALRATALLRTLREFQPDASITAFVPAAAQDLGTGLPEGVEYVFTRCLDQRPRWPAGIRLWWQLRLRRIDHVYLTGRRPYVRLAAYFAGIPHRIGISGGNTSLLLSETKRASEPNDVKQVASLPRLMGETRVYEGEVYTPSAESAQKIDDEIASIETSGPLIAIAPGGRPAWSAEHFAHLTNQLAIRHGAHVVLIGGDDDRAAIDNVLLDVADPPTDFGGKLSWDENAALLAHCDLCVSSDPLVLHLAAGVGCATLGLFRKNQAKRLTPPGVLNRAIESVSNNLDTIRVDDALACIEL